VAVDALADLPLDQRAPLLLVRGKPRGLRLKVERHWRGHLLLWLRATRRRRKLEARLAYYEERIEALRARTIFDRLRAGGLRLG